MTTTLVDAVVLDGMPEAEYHASPRLSYSGVKRLLAPSMPAKYRWEQDHPREPTEEMELGTAVHFEVLGTGQGWEEATAERRSNADKAVWADIRKRGLIPLRPKDAVTVQAMAAKVRQDPRAAALLTGSRREVSLMWTEPTTGVPMRARVDILPDAVPGRLLVAADLKTCESAHPVKLIKHMSEYRYDLQAAIYTEGLQLCGLAPDGAAMAFIFVEKTPPYLVNVVQVDPVNIEQAHEDYLYAAALWRRCTERDEWPGYDPTQIPTIYLPQWRRRASETIE